MALRYVQLFLPECDEQKLEQALAGRETLGVWQDRNIASKYVVHLLVQAEETEALLDEFQERFGRNEGFHAVVSAIEASLPRPKKPEKEDELENPEDAAEDRPRGFRVSREELYNELNDAIGLDRGNLAMICLSAVVAALGLLRDDVAVIIGAMVIAPLLGPNVAVSLAVTLGDLPLLHRALRTGLVGLLLALAVALTFGALLEVNLSSEQLASRTVVGLGDLGLALGAGAAGAVAYTRGMAGPVIGVMVAVALVPPLVAAGLLFGGGRPDLALEALILTAVNVISINVAGTLAFVLQGVRPRHWWKARQARRATWIAMGLWGALLVALIALILIDRGAEPLEILTK